MNLIDELPVWGEALPEAVSHMRINVDILKKELSDHVDQELKRFHEGLKCQTQLKN